MQRVVHFGHACLIVLRASIFDDGQCTLVSAAKSNRHVDYENTYLGRYGMEDDIE